MACRVTWMQEQAAAMPAGLASYLPCLLVICSVDPISSMETAKFPP